MDLGPQAADAVTAWPQKIFLEIRVPHDEPSVHMQLSWFQKRANRMPEALWLTFKPNARKPKAWKLSK
jgi:hypothetical protein